MSILLASGSPRRRSILETLGIEFTAVAPDVDERVLEHETPMDYVARVALAKAEAVHRDGAWTLAADTTVVLDERVLGKPVDADDARRMLADLSGRTHVVHTAVVAIGPAGSSVEVASTGVRFAALDADDIEWYVGTGEPLDKAGAYGLGGIGSVFVTAVSGDPHTVIGLPPAVARRVCRAAGFELLGPGR